MTAETHYCGPLEVKVTADRPEIRQVIDWYLSQFDVKWPGPHRLIDVDAQSSGSPSAPSAMVSPTFLDCGQMSVSKAGDEFFATTTAGASAEGTVGQGIDRWRLHVPEVMVEQEQLHQLEDLVGLAVMTGWRHERWVPMHAGAVVKGDRCALVCATSGGGKTTLTVALLDSGWLALGDDKLLLKTTAGARPMVSAVNHAFNLHPSIRAWIPRAGDLSNYPLDSKWGPKRRVKVSEIWPGSTSFEAHPTELVTLRRTSGTGVEVLPLSPEETLSALLRQTVVPNDPSSAALILSTVASTAQTLRGLRLDIGNNAYADGDSLSIVDRALG